MNGLYICFSFFVFSLVCLFGLMWFDALNVWRGLICWYGLIGFQLVFLPQRCDGTDWNRNCECEIWRWKIQRSGQHGMYAVRRRDFPLQGVWWPKGTTIVEYRWFHSTELKCLVDGTEISWRILMVLGWWISCEDMSWSRINCLMAADVS